MIWEDGYRLSRYFLVENRQKVGFDNYLPGSGLLIYHVDENRTWGPKDFFWGAMNDIETHKFVDLEEADGKDDLDNLNNTGDAGDVFPGASGNRSFDDNSIPDSRDYENRPTGVEIKKISISGSTMTAEITARNPVGYAIAYDKNGITDFTWNFEYNSDNWGGVLFTTSGSGTLAALDLGFYEHNTYYEINVYSSFSGVIPGKLLTRQTGYARYAGWQTVPLDTGVRLAESQDFFISIRNLGQSDAIAYDFYSPDLGRTYTSANGSTFSPYKANINIRARIRTAEETEPDLIKFKYNTGFEIYSSPAVGSDGTVYVGSADYYLYALNPYGTLKWRFGAMDWVDSSPALGSDGTIYAGSYDGYLYALNPNGTLKWKYRTDNGIFSSPALGSDGTVYAGSGDNYLYALNPVGTLKWKYKTGDFVGSSPAVGSDNTIYVGSDDSYLYALDSKGALKWRYKTGNYIGSSPAIGSDSTIYVGSADSLFYALNHNGTLKWKYQTEGRVMSSPAIDSDGTIYVGSYDSYLYALNPDGTLKWKYKTGDRIFSSPLISSGGIIYVGGEDSYLYALNSSGDLEWKFRTGGGINSSPSVGFDGMIYVGSNDGFLYALQKEHDAALANSSWPKFGHDLQKTSNALHENLEPELSRSCDFNADGRINITDVIVFLVLGRIDPKDPQLDWNRDGKFTVSDAVKLLNDIQSGNCPGSPVMLASAGALEPVSGLAGLSPEELAYLEQMLEQMSLTPEQKAAFQEALYGESGRSSLPKTFSLSQNAPNPFNPSTAISFQVPDGNSGQVTLKVYDLRGSLVRTLVDGPKEAGAYTVFWDGRDREGRRVSSGVYLYRMQAASFTRTRKMVMLK